MLRVVVVRSSGGAKQYYGTCDYYSEGQELVGDWGGAGAKRLGLSGRVERRAFGRMCDNEHPATGERFTPRTNYERRVAYDLNWHVPKSVSVLYGLTRSAEILAAFRGAVDETLRELEERAQTRVRVGGADELRATGNLVWANYVHTTARPVDGVPDPHLHCHSLVFNATFDPSEGRWKALDLFRIKQAAPYFEAAFHARLAHKLRELGYDTVRTAKGWELAGVPARVVREFSRRTQIVEQIAADRGIVDAHEKDALGALTRERKRTAFTMTELGRVWRGRLNEDEFRALMLVAGKDLQRAAPDPRAVRNALDFAVEHCFERGAAVPVDRLLAAALRRGVGEVEVGAVRAAFDTLGLLVREHDGITYATSHEVLLEESRMLAFAREGRGTCLPLVPVVRPVSRDWLSDEQKAAVNYVLGSRDRVVLIRGAAGTGKTALMAEAVEAIREFGKTVVPLAPTSAASRGVLRAEGFSEAETVARFLLDEGLRERARGQVIWVDEAGLLGTAALGALFSAAGRLDARVVLVGDTRQHSSVVRGTALRLLEREAGLSERSVTEIRRQTGLYRKAVGLLSEGNVPAALGVLDRLGWVRECKEDNRDRLIASEYLSALREKKTVLVVSPTHAEGERVTHAVRAALGSANVLTGEAKKFVRLVALGMTVAERGDPAKYESEFVVQFHQHAPGFRSASRWSVVAVSREGLLVRGGDGGEATILFRYADRFDVFRPSELLLRVGDRVRITRNGRARDGRRRLDNGTISAVERFTPNGDIELTSGAVIPAGSGHIAYGYCVTSHASQGKTVDRVLVAQSAESFAAASREQLYVSVSRGRERTVIVTDDKDGLQRAAAQSDPRPAATEIFGQPAATLWRVWAQRRRVVSGSHVVRGSFDGTDRSVR